MAILPMTIGGGGGGTYKIHSESSFTLARNASKVITISDMSRYAFTYGTVKWTNTLPFLHSDVAGDRAYSSGAWNDSPATYLQVTVSGNQVTILNRSTSSATISQCYIQYE